MKSFLSEFRRAILLTVMLAVVCCGLYPLVVFGIAQTFFHSKANGSLLRDNHGTVIGSKLLAQSFTAPKYFHPRPSAAGHGYDGLNSGGSNLGPTSQQLDNAIKERIQAYRHENGLPDNDPVPADAVTTSGSGLDPHISVQNAELQAPRVAGARHVTLAKVQDLIRQHTESPDLGFLGEPRVNVLLLNLALDRLQ